ncbi:MAG: hypothetical protein R2761_29415 [Acidimicrobiales bacterium]
MLAYPAPYRRANGAEIVDTANDLAGGRWSARQSGALLAEGLRTRARQSTGGSPGQAWASGIALALALSHVASFAAVVMVYYGQSDVTVVAPSPLRDLLIVGIPLAALTVTTRWPMVVLVAAPVGLLLYGHQDGGSSSVPGQLIVVGLIPSILLAGAAAAVGDGRRALAPVQALGLLGAVVAVGWIVSPVAALQATGLVESIALPVVGIALVGIDPRPLAAASTIWLIRAGVGAAVLSSGGLDDSRTFALQTALMVGGALLGLLVAGLAGRRWLPATSR